MPRGFCLSALLALALLFAACSDTAGSRSAGAASEAHRADASAAAAADAKPLMTELKFAIRADQLAAARALFGLKDPGDTRLQVTFYDTPALELHQAGLILRSRKFKGSGDDVTVKLRPLARAEVAASWFALDGFKCEEDRTGTVSMESCSFSVDRSARDLDDVARGKRGIESLFSRQQRDFIRAYASITPDWSRLKVLGPIAAKEWDFSVPELDVALSAELWTLPDGSELLEFSTKVPRSLADATAAAFEAALASRGLDPTDSPKSKTLSALEVLAAD